LDAIIVSGMPAVGKTTVSKSIAQKTGLQLIGGGDVLKEMAVEEGYTPGGDDWWDAEEGMKFLKERRRSPNFDRDVDERLLKKAQKGDVVITSYTLPWLSKHGVKVWLSGSVQSRAHRMAKRDRSDVSKCLEVLAVRDRDNHRLYSALYGIDFGKDLTPFHLTVETDNIVESQVAGVVLEYVRNRRV
jgi:CMP/dCMP kinase